MSPIKAPKPPERGTSSHPPPDHFSDSLIAAVIKQLEAGKSVRRKLPSGSYLHMDRQVPFLVVYRQATMNDSSIVENLLRGEASYLVLHNGRRLGKSAVKLVSAISEYLGSVFGACIIIEIWSEYSDNFSAITPPFRPAFRIVTPRNDSLLSTARALEKGLSQIKVQRLSSHIIQDENSKPWRPDAPRLVPASLANQIHCHFLGIGIRPVYLDGDNGETFPLIRRIIHRGLGRAIRKTVFEFMRENTTQRPPHFHALGPNRLGKLVWEVDKKLAQIIEGFDFLLSVTPINVEHVWSRFKRARFEIEPKFIYRSLPINPAMLKYNLYKIPIERIDDPALEALFIAQRMELDRKLTMLSDRGTRRFLYGSLQLYGRVDDGLRETAISIMKHVPAKERPTRKEHQLGAVEFANRAREEIRCYANQTDKFTGQVKIRDDIVGMLVSNGNLLIGSQIKVADDRVKSLLAHEIGTHMVTYVNGKEHNDFISRSLRLRAKIPHCQTAY